MKTTATMTALLLASTLALPAQTTASPANQQTEEQQRRDQSAYSSAGQTGSSQSTPAYAQSQSSSSSANETAEQRREREAKDKEMNPRFSIKEPAASSSTSPSADLKFRTNQPADVQSPNQNASTSSQTTTQTGIQASTQTDVAVSGKMETEVRTVVQAIDAQGPVMVERISGQFAEVTCSEQNARALIAGLHNGTSVTLRGDDGQTATFTPTTRLGYGDAYIAMSLAVEALRTAGIVGCASPAQWQAVLLGGQLSGPTVRTTSVTTERFPGILVLHSQGGWTKVAQTTNVQLSQVVAKANTNLQINTTAHANSSTSSQQNLSEVGRPRNYDPRASNQSEQEKSAQEKSDKEKTDLGKKDHNSSHSQKPDDVKSPDMENPPKTLPKY